jgi:hypothetical protein
MQYVAFPPADAVVVGYLSEQLAALGDSATVATKIPSPRPTRLVRITASGGGGTLRTVLSARTVIVQCWEATEPDAGELAETCFGLLTWAWRNDAGAIRSASVVGAPASFPDPDTSLPRYQFTLSLDIRGTVHTI